RRLGTDRVDLYELHNARLPDVQRDDLFAELEQLRREGKVRAVGVALGPAIGWEEEGVRAIERGVDAGQTVHTVLEQDPGRALAFVVAQPSFTSVLPTLTTEEELVEYAGAADHPLTTDELSRIEELYAHNFHHVDEYVSP